MNSPFEKAEKVDSHLKLFIWGESGAGKTTLALQFPSPVVLDLEKGTAQYGDKFQFAVKNTTDVKEINNAVDWLLTNKHEFKTLIVDPITIYWDALQKKWQEILLVSRPTESSVIKGEGLDTFYELEQRDWGLIKSEYKKFIRKLLSLDMNVIVTAHGKIDDKTKRPNFDAEKSTAYWFDIVIELFMDGKKRMALANGGQNHKDRTGKLPTEPFEISYQIIEACFGKTMLEREAQPVRLVTLKEADAFIDLYISKGIPQKRIDEKLKGEGVTSLQELPFAILEEWTKKLKEIKTKNESK